jgi:hypothetical protein
VGSNNVQQLHLSNGIIIASHLAIRTEATIITACRAGASFEFEEQCLTSQNVFLNGFLAIIFDHGGRLFSITSKAKASHKVCHWILAFIKHSVAVLD